MMYKYLISILLCLGLCCGLKAQDAELTTLTTIVKSLRNGNQKKFDAAKATLANDRLWTPMNELAALEQGVECRASEGVPGFKLNKLLAGAEQMQRFETSTGNMLNGEDERYNYSLFERAIKAGRTASYSLKGRQGEQTFIFIPYDAKAKLNVSISSEGRAFTSTPYKDGSIRFTGTVAPGKSVDIKISNADNASRSFALLNHNPRK